MRLDPKADILSVVKDFSKPIKTPIFTSKISVDKMLNHLADKIDGDRRLEYINLVKPTLEKPLFITQESINGAQRFRFFKTFIDEKDKVVKFLNVVEDKNGELIEITATPIKNTDLKNLLKGKVIWGGDTLSDLSTPQTAKQGSEADKAIISQNSAKGETAEQGSKIEQAGAKQEVVKGEGWTMKDGGAAKQYAEHKFEPEKWINDLSGVLSDEWIANLKSLALKHPEMFKSEADVFRVIKEIKDNPTHFFKNNIDENALMVKHLDDKKVGEIGVRKSDGQIVHVTKNNKDKRIKELERRQDKLLGNTELEKVTGRRASTDTPVESRTMATANKAGSVANVKRQTVGTSTLPTPLSATDKTALKQDANSAGEAYSSATKGIIPQNSAKDETAIKTYVNPHIGAGLAGGTLNAKDENGNFDAEKFAKGFIYGLFGSKVTAATLKKTNPKLYDQIVNIGKDKAGKEKISSFVNKLKQDELGKLLQKTITNKDLSTKTKVEIIEAAKKRFAKETPKSLNGQSEAQMSESALKAKENNLKIDDVSNDAKEKWIKTFGLKSIDDDFIPNLKPEVKKAIKDKEIRLTKGSLLKIVARGREKYIPLIRQSLEDTDMVLKDEGTFLFVKEMDDKSLVFTSVGRNFDTHITIISNAPKKINNIKNKLMNKAEVVYRSSKLRTTPL